MNNFEPYPHMYYSSNVERYQMQQGDKKFIMWKQYNKGELTSIEMDLRENGVLQSYKITSFKNGKPVSIDHEYRNGLQVHKVKENGKWLVKRMSANNSDLHERTARDVSLRKTNGIVLDEQSIKYIQELPTTFKKVLKSTLEKLIKMATDAIK